MLLMTRGITLNPKLFKYLKSPQGRPKYNTEKIPSNFNETISMMQKLKITKVISSTMVKKLVDTKYKY